MIKHFFTLVALVLTQLVSWSTEYHLDPAGSDANAGTIGSRWFSLNKAWQVVGPDDIVWLHGGTYSYTAQLQGYCTGKDGTAGHLILVSNWPGEVPIITKGPGYTNNVQHWRGGVFFEGDYVHWRGIEFTGFKHGEGESSPFIWRGFYMENSNHNILEQLRSYANEYGISVQDNSRDNLVKNCDVMYNYDVNTGGGNADGLGFNYITVTDPDNPNIARGVRSWWNGDDGLDGWTGAESGGIIIFDSCWSWLNGYFPGTTNPAGNGEGFKGGGGGSANPTVFQRIYQNCAAFYNKHDGFNQNNLNAKVKVHNCIAFKNAITGINFSENNNAHEWVNTWSFDNTSCQVYITAESSVTNCSYGTNGGGQSTICGPGSGLPGWTGNVSTADFITTDTTGVGGARQSNGTLPALNFYHLTTGSDLIDAGTSIGIPFNGAAPDRGAFESGGGGGNTPPTCSSGGTTTITLPVNQVTLSNSPTDSDGSITGMAWSKTSGPATYTIVSPTSGTTDITGLVQGTYVFQFQATDNGGATCTASYTVIVQPQPVSNTSNTIYFLRGKFYN